MRAAILGTGNIGTELLIKVLLSAWLECRLFAGRNLLSPGIMKADQLGEPIWGKSIQSSVARRVEFDLVFGAISAEDHQRHASLPANPGLLSFDLAPAGAGKMCAPAAKLEECLEAQNLSTVFCGGQASIPLIFATASEDRDIEHAETVSSIASRSAGPATCINLDEYLTATETSLSASSRGARPKATLNLHPAPHRVHMQTTVLAKIKQPDSGRTRAAVASRRRTFRLANKAKAGGLLGWQPTSSPKPSVKKMPAWCRTQPNPLSE